MKDVQERLCKVLRDGSEYYYSDLALNIRSLTNKCITDDIPEINIIEHRLTPMYNDYEILSYIVFGFEGRFFKLEYELNSIEDMEFPYGLKEVFPVEKTITEYV